MDPSELTELPDVGLSSTAVEEFPGVIPVFVRD